MLLDYEIFKWMISSKIIPRPEKPMVRADGKVELDDPTKKLFLNGMIFSKIIKIIKKQHEDSSRRPIQTPPNLNQLKEAATSGARVYNWNIIADCLSKFNYTIQQDIKDLIIAGDEDMILQTLKEVHKMIVRFNKLSTIDRENSPNDNVSITSSEAVAHITDSPHNRLTGKGFHPDNTYSKQSQTQKAMQNKNGYVNLDHIDPQTPLDDTNSLLEFLLVSLSQCLSLNAKQSMTLLMQGNKYLAHVLAKGVKGNFEPVINWYKQLYASGKHLMNLVIKEESQDSIFTILQALKPGLYSKSEDVAQWACRILGKIAYDFSNNELLPAAWEWFINDNGGLYACLACLKRHQDLAQSVVATMTQFGRYNMLEMFTVEMKKILIDPLDYLHNILEMMRPLTEAKFTKEELLSSSIVDFWIDFCMRNSDAMAKGSSPQLRSASLSLLCNIWEVYGHKVESTEGLGNQILTLLKRAIRDRHQALKMTALTYLFRILESFVSERNPYAPIVYKIITFTLIENHEDISMREYILANICHILKSSPTIPVGIIVEPLAKQIQASEGTTYVLNTFDFNFMEIAANHPKLSLKHAIQLIDSLAKIYLTNLIFAYLAGAPLLTICARYIEEDAMQEYLIEFAKLCLSKYHASMKKRKNKDFKLENLKLNQDIYAGPTSINAETEAEISHAQRRGLIIHILKEIISLNSAGLNEKFKTLIVYTNSQLSEYLGHDVKALRHLLSLLGDADEIINDYKKEKEIPPLQFMDYPKNINSRYDPAQSIAPQSTTAFQPDIDFEAINQRASLQSTRAKEVSDSTKNPIILTENFLKTGLEHKPEPQDDTVRFEEANDAISMQDFARSPKKRTVVDTSMDRSPRRGDSLKKRDNSKGRLMYLKALEDIENIKLKNQEKQQEKELMDEMKKMKDEKTKEALRRQIEKRKVELGVNSNGNDIDPKLLVGSEGQLDKKPKDNEVIIVDLDEEEFFQKEIITIFIKQNIKKYKYLFNKYGSTSASYQKAKTFDNLRVQYNSINLNEIIKMIKENSMNSFVSKDEITQVFRLVNAKILRKNEMDAFAFEGFVKFLTQLAIHMFSKPPMDQVNVNYGDCLERFMALVYVNAKERGEHRLLLDESAPQETEELIQLNKDIQENPNVRLPEGYKKIMDTNVEYIYRLPPNLFPKSYKVCYELVNDLIVDLFKVPVMEKKSLFSTIMKVVPQTKPEISSKPPVVRNDKMDRTNLKETKDTNNETRGRSAYSVEKIESKKDLSAGPRDRSVDGGKMPSKILNKVMEERIKKEEEEKMATIEAEKKRAQRNKEIEERMRGVKEKKAQQIYQKEEEEKKREMLRLQQEKEKELKIKQELEKKKALVKEYKEKKAAETITKVEEEKNNQENQILNLKKDREDFMKKQKIQMKQQFNDQKKKREEEEQIKKKKEEEEKAKRDKLKKKAESEFENDRARREKEKELNATILKYHEAQPYKDTYNKYTKQLQQVFKHYKEDNLAETINFRSYMKFAAQFNVFPSLVAAEQLNLIFRSLTKDKRTNPNSLSFDEFLQSLLRVSLKSQSILNKIYEKFMATGESTKNADDFKKIINAARQSGGEQVYSEEQENQIKNGVEYDDNTVSNEKNDEYDKLDELKPQTLEGLLFFLDLPPDSKLMNDKLKALKSDNQRLNPRDKKLMAIAMTKGKRSDTKSGSPGKENLQEVSPRELSPMTKTETITSPNGNKENWNLKN